MYFLFAFDLYKVVIDYIVANLVKLEECKCSTSIFWRWGKKGKSIDLLFFSFGHLTAGIHQLNITYATILYTFIVASVEILIGSSKKLSLNKLLSFYSKFQLYESKLEKNHTIGNRLSIEQAYSNLTLIRVVSTYYSIQRFIWIVQCCEALLAGTEIALNLRNIFLGCPPYLFAHIKCRL